MTASSAIPDVEVSGVFFDNRKVLPQSVFVAIRGSQNDGHRFLNDALVAQAAAVIVEAEDLEHATSCAERHGLDLKKQIVAYASSTRLALAELAAAFANFPSRDLLTVAVTGTNGKTTSTHMIEHVLNWGGCPTGVIGTIDHHLGSHVWPTAMTTPDPVEFQMRLREFHSLGARAVALEASSHALDQRRLDAVDFDLAIFTNLTRDHLDYHQAMETYFSAKHRLFSELLMRSGKKLRTALLNSDDTWAMRTFDEIQKLGNPQLRVWTFGEEKKSPKSDFRYRVVAQGFDGVQFQLKTPTQELEMHLTMPGIHNVQNAIGAFVSGLVAGLSPALIVESLQELKGVPGRLERVTNDRGLHVFVDYAHTDDALKAILEMLTSIRREAKNSKEPSSARDATARIITVFGCGGDRDRGKRPLMMRSALDGSDEVILTSDNPRNEDPEQILDDAMAAVQVSEHSKVRRYVDRRLAIEKALQSARLGDVVLIAGKGHEQTQQIGMTKHPFSDVQVAKDFFQRKPDV